MRASRLSSLSLFIFLFSSVYSNALRVNFLCISSNSADNCAVGQTQLFVDVLPEGTDDVRFTFYNMGDKRSSITGVYFDDGTLLGISQVLDEDENGGSDGVDFTSGSASPPNLPGAASVDPAFNTTAGFLADADSPQRQQNGVNPGEWLGIVFDLQSQQNFDSVIHDLETGALRIGLHVIGFDNGGSESFINSTAVPLPPALSFFITGLAGLSVVRRKIIRRAFA